MDSVEVSPGVCITSDRCLLMDGGRTAVIGDLHLGYESALESEGMYLPHFNTGSIRDAVNRILWRYEPRHVVLLGDIKHDFRRASRDGRDEVSLVISILSEAADVTVVKGNHDNYLQNILAEYGLDAVDHCDIGGYRLEHGHVDSGVRPVIIGHEHPSVRIKGASGGSIKLQCFLSNAEDGIIVIPPFSPMSSGTDFSDTEQFMSPSCRAVDMGKSDVFGISDDGIIPLGKLRQISDLQI